MDNLNHISYADDWKNADNPVSFKRSWEIDEQPRKEKKEKKKEKSAKSRPLLIIIQIITCLIIVIAAYLLKTFGGEYYKTAKSWYENELNDEIILASGFENNGLSRLFDAAED